MNLEGPNAEDATSYEKEIFNAQDIGISVLSCTYLTLFNMLDGYPVSLRVRKFKTESAEELIARLEEGFGAVDG